MQKKIFSVPFLLISIILISAATVIVCTFLWVTNENNDDNCPPYGTSTTLPAAFSKNGESHKGHGTHIESDKELNKDVESDRELNKTIETDKELNKNVESDRKLNENVETGKWLKNKTIESDRGPDKKVESDKELENNVEYNGEEHDDKESIYGKYLYKNGAVSSNDQLCSEYGRDMLALLGGNAVDAAVATLLCNGIVQPHSSGIGGGAFFVIYDTEQGWHTIDSREVAPLAATENMFARRRGRSMSKVGGLSIGVPGELKGIYDVHKKFGSLPWSQITIAAKNVLEDGYRLNKWTQEQVVKLQNYDGFEAFLDRFGHPLPVGSLIFNDKLKKTFETIIEDPMSFYTGDLAKDIALDIQDAGGIITTEDLETYETEWRDTTEMDLPGGYTLHSMPAPGSGPVLSYILSILSGYNFTASSVDTDDKKILTYHRIVEAMKFAYARRSDLGDPAFEDVYQHVRELTSRKYGEQTRRSITDDMTQDPFYYQPHFYTNQDHGTSHVSVVDSQGNAVSVTSSLNLYFGSKVVGRRTGIVFNNVMDDFSTPNLMNAYGLNPSKVNFIKPGKRPLSSMTPSIIFDNTKKRVRMVVGGAGGPRITTSTAKLIMDVLWFNLSLDEAMYLPRFHHQLMPNVIRIESSFPSVIQDGLRAKGHSVRTKRYMSACYVIDVKDGGLDAASDRRQGGMSAGY